MKILYCLILFMLLIGATGCAVLQAVPSDQNTSEEISIPTAPATGEVNDFPEGLLEEIEKDPELSMIYKYYPGVFLESPLPQTHPLPISYEIRSAPLQYEGECIVGNIGKIKQGKLICTIRNAYLVNSEAQLENPDGVVLRDQFLHYWDENGRQECLYQDLVNEDGSYKRGMVMLVLDMTVTSENAHNWTSSDLLKHSDGYVGTIGMDSNPYAFRAPGPAIRDVHQGYNSYCLEPNYEEFTNTVPIYEAQYQMIYFSRAREFTSQLSNWCTICVEPGESIDYSVGYVFIPEENGGEVNLDTLYLEARECYYQDRFLGELRTRLNGDFFPDHAMFAHLECPPVKTKGEG